MLVYLATYPRCGAAFLRSTIFLNWRYIVSEGYVEHHAWPAKHGISATRDSDILVHRGLEGDLRYIVRPGVITRSALTHDLRRKLAALPGLVFLKTHERPPVDPLPGEVSVQMVRHPGAALVSSRRLYERYFTTRTLRELIDGCELGGRWADYHEAWSSTQMPLARLFYEDAIKRPAGLVRSLARFLGLPAPAAPRVQSTGEAAAINPLRNAGAGVDGWRSEISPDDLDHLYRVNGKVAAKLGYGPASFRLHCDAESAAC